MADPSLLEEIRAIEQLKARYCRLLDTKDWGGFRSVFADDFVSDTTGSGGSVIHGADEFVAFVRRTLAKAVTVHHVQQPEVEVVAPGSARGVWAMEDLVRFAPGLTLHGFGHYVESYEQRSGEWRITTSKLTRLRMELHTPVLSLVVSERMQRRLARAARHRAQ